MVRIWEEVKIKFFDFLLLLMYCSCKKKCESYLYLIGFKNKWVVPEVDEGNEDSLA